MLALRGDSTDLWPQTPLEQLLGEHRTHRTVYSGRCEADVVMTSIERVSICLLFCYSISSLNTELTQRDFCLDYAFLAFPCTLTHLAPIHIL